MMACMILVSGGSLVENIHDDCHATPMLEKIAKLLACQHLTLSTFPIRDVARFGDVVLRATIKEK